MFACCKVVGAKHESHLIRSRHLTSREEPARLQQASYILEQTGELPSIEFAVSLIQECRASKESLHAIRLFRTLYFLGLESQGVLGNHIVPMLTECGCIFEAQQLFDKLRIRNEHVWTSLIRCYIDCTQLDYAFELFCRMKGEHVLPSMYTFHSLLMACGQQKQSEMGLELHTGVVKDGYEKLRLICITLVGMYAKCGLLLEAGHALGSMPAGDVIAWSALATGYAEHGYMEKAMGCLEHMHHHGVSPNCVTYVSCLKVSGKMRATHHGYELHTKIVRQGYDAESVVCNALLDTYARCGTLAEARRVFDKFSSRSLVSWTTLITGYVENGYDEEALTYLENMQEEVMSLDPAAFVCSLKVCGLLGAIRKGLELHACIIKDGYEQNCVIGNALVDMHSKFGLLLEAQEVFDELAIRDVIAWNVLIGMYAEHELYEELLNKLEAMHLEHVSGNAVTFASSLKAYANAGALDRGKELHVQCVKLGHEDDDFVGISLLEMYSRCGSIMEGHTIFAKKLAIDIVWYNAMIDGYACVGEIDLIFQLLIEMRKEGILPNNVTIVCILNACCHSGIVNEGQRFFAAINMDFDLMPTLEHHSCIVDVLGRAGQIGEASSILETMPFQPDLIAWNVLIGVCQKWCDIEVGEKAFDYAVMLHDNVAATCISMFNICACVELMERTTFLKGG